MPRRHGEHGCQGSLSRTQTNRVTFSTDGKDVFLEFLFILDTSLRLYERDALFVHVVHILTSFQGV